MNQNSSFIVEKEHQNWTPPPHIQEQKEKEIHIAYIKNAVID